MNAIFKNVYVVKPHSSRASSKEAFVIGLGFKPEGNVDDVLASSMKGLRDEIGDEKAIEEKVEE